MEWLTIILVVLAVPFFIGYVIGKGSSQNSSKNDEARLDGQREVRDYLLNFISSQPTHIKKSELLKVMGSSESEVRSAHASTYNLDLDDELPQQEPKSEKPKNEDQNINVILYVASFLLVAAAVLFIGTNVYDGMKFIGAWTISAGFYLAGMALHTFSTRLKPAAVAFVGTGLALLPFAGLATNSFLLHDPQASWFITSLIGVPAFLYATVRLRSQVLAYLTIGFIFSLTTSSVAVLQAPMVWSFVLVIATGTLFNLLAFVKPKTVPEVFQKPIDDSAQIAVPLAVIGSWIIPNGLPLWQGGLILAVAALHYAVAALRPSNPSYRPAYLFSARLAAMLSALVFTYDHWQTWESVGLSLSFIASLQVLASVIIVKVKSNSYDIVWLWLGMILQVFAITAWLGLDNRAEMTTASLVLVTVTSLLISVVIKKSRYSVFAVLAIAALVWQVGTDLLQPRVEDHILALIFLAGSAASLAIRQLWCKTGERLNVSASACMLYGAIALSITPFISSQWQLAVLAGLAIIAAAASHIERQPNFYILTSILIAIASYVGTDLMHIKHDEIRLLMSAWTSAFILYVFRGYFGYKKDKERSAIMAAAAIIVMAFVALIFIFDHTQRAFAASTMLAASMLLYGEAYLLKRQILKDVAVILGTLALQRLVPDELDLDGLVYTHWWALTIGYLSWVRYNLGQKENAKGLLIGALVFMSVPTGLAALGDQSKYQIPFLLEHIALLVVGGLISFRLLTIWGAVGVGLAVLYWLQGYTYIMVGLAGLGLIVFAVWRLLSKDK